MPVVPAPQAAPARPGSRFRLRRRHRPATNPPTETWVALGRWCRSNGLTAPCPLATALAPSYVLSTTNGVFMLRVGSLVAHWDGLEVRMAFAPQLMDRQPYVHALDLKKTLQPLVLGGPGLAPRRPT